MIYWMHTTHTKFLPFNGASNWQNVKTLGINSYMCKILEIVATPWLREKSFWQENGLCSFYLKSKSEGEARHLTCITSRSEGHDNNDTTQG